MFSILRFLRAHYLAIGFAMVAVYAGETVRAQSDIVFVTTDSRLYRFDAGVETFATNSNGPDAFLGVAILNGEVLVADRVGNAIERFSPVGTYLGSFGSLPGSPLFLESDSSGNVYTTLRSFLPGDPQIAPAL